MLRALRARAGLSALMSVVGALLRLLALDVDSRHSQGISIIFYLLAAMTIALYMYAYHVSAYWYIFTRGRSDPVFCINIFSLTISSLIGVIKLLYMYFNSKKLKELVFEYLECDTTVSPDSRMSRRVLSTLVFVRRRAVMFWLLTIGNGVLYVLRPLITTGRHLLDDKQILLGLEPMFKSPNYEIAFMIEVVSTFFIVYAPANVTAFVIIIVGYTEAQMLALSQELLNLWEDAQSYYQKVTRNTEATSVVVTCNQNDQLDYVLFANTRERGSRRHSENVTEKTIIINDYVKRRLISIMKLHALNINLIKKVDSLFKRPIAVEFILLSVALIAQLLRGLENTYIEVPFALIHVSIECITGQKLMDANRAFEAAVYDCRWENIDTSNMKLVLVMLQSAQKTMELSAGGITSLSYLTFMSVIRSIYTAYTALHSVMN